MAAQQYQAKVYKLLVRIFGQERVRSEWNIRGDAADKFKNPATYAPRVDIAVGPFNLTADSVGHDVHKILEANGHRLMQEMIATIQTQNNDYFIENKNPRCLLAIEIEFSGSSKHILGDIPTASMTGLVGVVIGPSKSIRKIERVSQYVRLLRSVKKAPPDLFANVACFEAKHFVKLLEKHLPKVIK